MELTLKSKIKPINTLGCLGPVGLFDEDVEVYIDEKKYPERLAKIILDGLHAQTIHILDEIKNG